MKCFVMTEVNVYLEEILEALDFDSLNAFLNEHMRVEMDFAELISRISIHGLEGLNRETVTQLFFDTIFYEISIARPIFIKMILFTVLFSIIHRLLASKKTYVSDIGFLLIYTSLMVLLMQSFFLVRDIAVEGMNGMLAFLQAGRHRPA